MEKQILLPQAPYERHISPTSETAWVTGITTPTGLKTLTTLSSTRKWQLIYLPTTQLYLILRLTKLGSHYGTRLQRLGNTKDLDRAIELTKTATALQPQDPTSLANSFIGLEIWINLRFEQFGNNNDPGEAIEVAEMAIVIYTAG